MYIPLAERLRPSSLSDFVGQDHLVGKEGFITKIIEKQKPLSLLLFGPPGCGKTTLARLYAKAFNLPFSNLSAVFNSAAELKKLLKEGQESPLFSRQILLFVDEIHRFNRAQQDIFLPFLEDGSLILIGATTENPSFAMVGALLSRLRVLQLNPLDQISLHKILNRSFEKAQIPPAREEVQNYLIDLSQGDGRHLLNLIENLEGIDLKAPLEEIASKLQRRPPLYDKQGEHHYNLISALHKSVRGSDPDAALYWFARMVAGGEDPLFIARRLIRMATEDVGLADPNALTLTIQAWQTYERLGSPEGELALAEAVLYLALSPKSNATYVAYQKALALAKETSHLSPPKEILNAPTKLMKQMGYGEGYVYDPDTPYGFSGQDYFPVGLEKPSFYDPVPRGYEREMRKRIDYFKKLASRLARNLKNPL